MWDRLELREAVNVDDLKLRDQLVRRVKKARAECVESKRLVEEYNREHPTEPPIGTAFEDAMIAWLDGNGPFPHKLALEVKQESHRGKIR